LLKIKGGIAFLSIIILVGYLCRMNFSVILPAFISFEELTVILILSVVIFGPKKIPEVARGLGEGLRAMKKATDDIKQELMKPVDDINPVKDIQDTIQKSKDQLTESITDIPDPKKEIESNLDDLTGPIKRK